MSGWDLDGDSVISSASDDHPNGSEPARPSEPTNTNQTRGSYGGISHIPSAFNRRSRTITPEIPTLDGLDDSPRPHKRQRINTEAAKPERLRWSSDESNGDRKSIKEKLKARKIQRNGRAMENGKRARETDGEKTDSTRQSKMRALNAAGARSSTSTVGMKTAQRKGRSGKARNYGDESDEGDSTDSNIPDYIRDRRSRFNSRVEKLKEGGLNLPPSYDSVSFSDDEHLEHLKEKPLFTHIKPCRKYEDIHLPYSLGLIPAPIAQWLRDYQVKGAEFLHRLFVYQNGGILGDDMGLGKTIQIIAFLTAVYGKTGDERDGKRMRKMRRLADHEGEEAWYPRTLIICPGTLIQNWRNEFEQWGWWYLEIYHGNSAAKEAALEAASSGRCEILITTYTTYRMNKDHINLVRWDCVVADECHILKERKSDTSKSMTEVNALCRIGLTGTAIQNKYEELWTLLNWSNPGALGPVSTWKTTICEPLKVGQSHNATGRELRLARQTAKKLVENLLPQFLLRRMKTLIKDQLPKKSDRVVFCPLTDTQADAYENFTESEIVQYIKQSADPCDCGSGKRQGWCCYAYIGSRGRWQNYVFPAISTLQKLSNHLALLIPQSMDNKDKQAKDLDTLEIAVPDQWRDLYRSRDSILNYSNPEFCGKWKILKKLLKHWHAQGDKVLVFSHSVRLLRMLQLLFNHTSYNVSYLDGSMSYEDRARTVDDFNSDPAQFVFLISTKAGGVGLNITSANKVVVVDPNWNPSHDLQAQDRAYRIGQTRDVEVFRLVSAGTMEEIIYARQIYKQQQANIGYNASNERRYFQGVMEKKDQKGELFGLANLFGFQSNNLVLREIVNKTNIAESRAGVRVAGLDIDEDELNAADDDTSSPRTRSATPRIKSEPDDDNVAMSQLAALITSQEAVSAAATHKSSSFLPDSFNNKPRRHDPVQAILSSAGVQYTHENSEVIGSSKVESRLSRKAELRETAQNEDARVFGSESQAQKRANVVSIDDRGRVSGLNYQYRYRPPQLVKERQFCEMARWAGCEEGASEFGLKVEGWTQGERREFLDKFYKWRERVLLGEDREEGEGDEAEAGMKVEEQQENKEDGDEAEDGNGQDDEQDVPLSEEEAPALALAGQEKGSERGEAVDCDTNEDGDDDDDDDDDGEL